MHFYTYSPLSGKSLRSHISAIKAKSKGNKIYPPLLLCRWPDSNRHGCSPLDFESSASANSATAASPLLF